MNRIYRCIFNHSLGVWQAVSELGRQGRGGRSRGRARMSAFALLAATGLSAPGLAAACDAIGPSVASTNSTTVIGPASATDNCVDWTIPITIDGGQLTVAGGPVQINQIGGLAGSLDWTMYIAAPGLTWAVVTDSPAATGTVTLRTDSHAATLQIGNGGTTGSYAGNISIANAGGRVVFNRSDNVTYGQTISGTGRLVQAGSGVLTLAGNNSGFTGTTEVSNGTLALASASSIGSGPLSLQGGQLTALNTMTIAPAVTVFGAGKTSTVTAVTGQTLTLAPTDLQLEAGAVARFGSATDSGTVVLAPGTATVVDTTGRVEVAGGTLRMGNANAAGHLGRAAGVTVGAGSTLDLDTFSTGIKDLQGSGTIVTGVGRTLSLETGDFAGAITGGSRLSKAGTGVLVLSGDNSYSGTTTVLQGELRIGNGGTSGSLGAGALSNAGNVVFDRSDTHIVANELGGAGTFAKQGTGTTVLTGANNFGGTLSITAGTLQVGNGGTTGTLGTGAVTNNATLAFDRSDTHVVANDIGGSGGLVQRGTGTLVLTGANSYAGATTVSAGTLQVGNGGAAGSLGTGAVTNNAMLAFNRSDTVTIANAITGTGALTQGGTGTTILTGANAYGGTTAINAGTLQVGNGGTTGTLGSGNVTNNGTLALNRSDAVTVANAITGTGALAHAGPGTTTLTGANAYTGTTTIAAGTLQVGTGGTTGALGTGNVTNNGALVFNRSDTVTIAQAIAGSGTLEQLGTGRLTLTGANSYGATVISAGTLQVGDGGTTGSLGASNVTNHGALAFNRSDTVSLANVINGTGSLTQAGSGNLVLTGANTYTGGTFVNAGTLSVNGSIVGNTSVNNGGTLGGSGTVGSVSVASGGTLAPGNSIGTLTVNGNLRFAPGSTYRVEANAAGAADRVNTVGAGTITIDGGTVDVQAGGAGYQRNTDYTILRSGGATAGRFTNVTSNLAFLTPTLVYSADGVVLNLQAGADAPAYASAARTRNQTAVANYLQGIANTPGDAAALIQQIDNMTADQASASFESMAGSAHASASQVASALGRNFSATLASRSGFSISGLGNAMNDWSQVRYASLAPVETSLASAQERGLWAQALGAGGRVDSDGNAAGSRYRNSGLVLGYDQPVTGQWLAGGAVGYSTSWWNATSGDPSSGKIESPQAGLYARYTNDSVRVRLDGTFSSHDFTTDRTVNLAGVGATANSKHKGREWGLGAQVEMPIKAGEWEVRPLAGLRYAHLNEDGFSETGQSPANLAVAERTTQNTLLSAGMHFVRPFNQGKAGLELRAVASHLAGDNDSPVTASLIGQPGSFTATGVPLKRNALTLGTTVSGQFTRNVSAYLDANYEVRGSGQNAYQFTGGVRVSF